MSPPDAAAPAANVLLTEIGAFTLTVLASVIVSLVTLWLAGRQRARQEQQAESRRREAVLAAIGRERRWNRGATGGQLDARNAHVMVGALTSVAFDAHAGELATIAPESVATVYEHYGMVGRAQEGIRALGHPAPTPTNRFARTGLECVWKPASPSPTRPPKLSVGWGFPSRTDGRTTRLLWRVTRLPLQTGQEATSDPSNPRTG